MSIAELVTQLQAALAARNSDQWFAAFYIPDQIARQAQERWFEGYLKTPAFCSAALTVCAAGADEVQCKLRFEYDRYDPITEKHRYTLGEIDGRLRIVDMEKVPDRTANAADIHLRFDTPPAECRQLPTSPHPVANDPLSVAHYSRAIPRTVRYREAHPELESAAILADMMSARVAQVAQQIKGPDAKQSLLNLYQAARRQIKIRLTRDDRSNSWRSKLHVPWYGFDELAAMRDGQMIVGSCPSIMSFYLAVLRLTGQFQPSDLLQLRLHNQDVLLVQADGQPFLLCSDGLVEATARTYYYLQKVFKVFNESWFCTRLGATNVPDAVDIAAQLQQAMPLFNFEMAVTSSETPPVPLTAVQLLNKSSQTVTQTILRLSQQYPYSPYTWAKYAYQLLTVAKPEVYASYSAKNLLLQAWCREMGTVTAVLNSLPQLCPESIFGENGRLMTADQVVRHEKGDAKALALLLFAVHQQHKLPGCVILTTHSAYCAWQHNHKWRIFDTKKFTRVSQPEGNLSLAFDDRTSIYSDQKPVTQSPDWLVLL